MGLSSVVNVNTSIVSSVVLRFKHVTPLRMLEIADVSPWGCMVLLQMIESTHVYGTVEEACQCSNENCITYYVLYCQS